LTRKKVLDLLKWVWIAAVLGGAGYYFYSNYQEISQYLATVSWPRLGISFLLLLAGKLTLSDLTRFSLKKIAYSIPYTQALTITSVTQLGKYLPGGIWHVAGKFGFYKARQIDTKKATQAIVYENVWLLSSALVIGAVLLLGANPEVACEFQSVFCNQAVNRCILVGLPIVWIASLIIFERLFFRKSQLNIWDFAIKLVQMLVIWLSFGISFWLVFPLHSGYLPAITGAFSLSWVAGYVAFFAPGGIGIRELLLTLLLAAQFSSSEVAVYASLHRLLWVLEEILLGAGSTLFFGLPMTTEESRSNTST